MKHLNRSLKEFEQVSRSQAKKGLVKYGQTLNPLDDYCWLDMELEELVDAVQYNRAQKDKQSFVLDKIRKLTDDNEIHFWCDELEGKNRE